MNASEAFIIARMMQNQPNTYPSIVKENPTIPEDVLAHICLHFKLSKEELLNSSRERKDVWPRQVGMALSRHFTEASYQKIAEVFGSKNHGSAARSIKRVEKVIASNKIKAAQFKELINKLTEWMK